MDTVIMRGTDHLTLRPVVGIVGRKDLALAREELGCDYVEYIGAMVMPHPANAARNTIIYRYRAGMFARPQ